MTFGERVCKKILSTKKGEKARFLYNRNLCCTKKWMPQTAFVLGNGWKASVFLEVYGGGCYNVTELLHNQKGTKEKTAESVCIENENLLREEKGKSR